MGAQDIDPVQPQTIRSTLQLSSLGSAPSGEDAHSGQIQAGECVSEGCWWCVLSCGLGDSEEAEFCSGVDRILDDPCWRRKTSAWSRIRLD